MFNFTLSIYGRDGHPEPTRLLCSAPQQPNPFYCQAMMGVLESRLILVPLLL